MHYHRSLLACGVGFAALLAAPTYARAPDPDAKDAPLFIPIEDEAQEEEEEELLVISATRSARTLEEAPSIITVLTREEILASGYSTLGEVLRNVVGYEINDNGHWPETGVRGINARMTYGDKIQILLDGHNMAWRQFNRNLHSQAWVPLEHVSRIEFVRGSGGAIWGANALNGLVNIVLREDFNGAEVNVGVDHEIESKSVSARAGTSGADYAVYGSVSYYSEDADAFLPPIHDFQKLANGPTEFVKGDYDQGGVFFIKGHYKDLGLFVYQNHRTTGAPMSSFSIVGGDDSRFVTNRSIARLSYDTSLTDEFDLQMELDADVMHFAPGTVYEANPGSTVTGDPATGLPGGSRYLREMRARDERYELRIRGQWVASLALQAVFGAELEYLDLVRWHFPEVWSYDGLERPKFKNRRGGFFAHVDFSPIPALALAAGARFDYDEVFEAVITPKASVVLRLPVGLFVKALFGTGYKPPSFHDLYYFRRDAFYGNPHLAPETAYTGELQLGFKLPRRLDVRLTGFYTNIDKLIGYARSEADVALEGAEDFPASQLPSGTSTYSQKKNLEYVTTMGVEFETWFRVQKRVSLKLHATYRQPRDPDGERLDYSAEWVAGGTLTLDLGHDIQATLRILGVGEKTVPARAFSQPGFPTWTADNDPTTQAPAYGVATFVLRAPNLFAKGLGFTLKLDNVTDTDYWDPGREILYPQPRFRGFLWLTGTLPSAG